MKKPILYILLFIGMGRSLQTQAQLETGLNKDSLQKALRQMPMDTLRVHALIRLGQQYESNQPDSALHYYTEARNLSEQLHYPAGFARYVANYTAVLNVQGRFDESLKLNLQALDTCKKYGLTQQYVKALSNTGAVYQYKDDYTNAANYYLQVLPYWEASGDDQMLSILCGNLCGLYRNLRQTGKAKTYAGRALEYAKKKQDLNAMGAAYNNMANVLKDLGRHDEAIRYLDSAYRIGRQLNDINMQETALINQGDAYTKKAQYDNSIAYYRKAMPLAAELGDVSGQALSSLGIAIGLFRQKNLPAARQELTHTIDFANRHDQPEVLSHGLLLMSDVLIAAGHFDSAETYRDRYDSVSNHLLNAGVLKNVQELETKYDVEKNKRQILEKDLLLEQQHRESLRQKIFSYVSLAGAATLCLLLIGGYRAYRQKQALNQKELETLRAEQENIRLKALLDGQEQERRRISQEIHDDIGSGLTSMVFLSRTLQDAGPAAARIQSNAENLMKKMNEIIWTMNHEEDTLDSLLSYIRVNAAEALDTAGIDYRFQIDEHIPAKSLSQEFRRNVYLVIKEAIHNAIRHAAATQVIITIRIGHTLSITVGDNGKGFDGAEGRRFGNGLKNMRRRASGLGGQISIQAGISQPIEPVTGSGRGPAEAGSAGTLVILEAPWPV